VAIAPTTLTLAPAVPAAPTLFTATLTGVPTNVSTAVTWEVGNVIGGNATVGSIVPVSAPAAGCQTTPPCTATANYTPPQVPPPGGTAVVNVYLTAFPSQSAGTTITLQYGPPSIAGSYAFSIAGQNSSGGFFTRAGQLTANIVGGVGTLSGIEDIHTPTTVTADTAVNGTYTVGPDGRGTAVLTDTTGTTNYYLTVVSANQIGLTEADNSATAHGEADLQDPTSFAQSKFLGGYAFDFYGTSGAAHPTSEVGQFTATGSGAAIQNGLEDVNAAGTLTPAAGFSGSFGAINSGTGRGTATINGFSGPTTFAFYMISSGEARFIETDASANLVGDALLQAGAANLGYLSSLNMFTVSGRSGTGRYAMAGEFLADGNGTLCVGGLPNSNCLLDQNNNGTVATTVQYTGTYTVAASGRGTVTFNPSGQAPMTFVMYFVSTGDAVIQETDSSVVADGILLEQSGGTLTTPNVSGSFALNWTGAAPSITTPQDTTGQLTVGKTPGAVAGTWDRNDALVLQPGVTLTGTYALAINDRGTVTLTDASNITYDLAAYAVNKSRLFLIDTDPTLVFSGQLKQQF